MALPPPDSVFPFEALEEARKQIDQIIGLSAQFLKSTLEKSTREAPPVLSLHHAFTSDFYDVDRDRLLLAGDPLRELEEHRATERLRSWTLGLRPVLGTYMGVELVVDPNLTDYVEDWSNVRSPGRARRRRAQGHRQNIKLIERKDGYMIEGRLHVTPRQHQEMIRRMDRMAAEAFLGGK